MFAFQEELRVLADRDRLIKMCVSGSGVGIGVIESRIGELDGD